MELIQYAPYVAPILLIVVGFIWGSGYFSKSHSSSKILETTSKEREDDKQRYEKAEQEAEATDNFLEKQLAKEEKEQKDIDNQIAEIQEEIEEITAITSKTEEEIKADYEKQGFKVEDF